MTLKLSESVNENIARSTTCKMHRKDGQTTDYIYENDDVIKGHFGKEITDSTQGKSSELTGSDSVRNRSSRAAAVCLGLLCVLLLTAVIVLCVHIYTKSTNYTEERDQLLTNITNLTEERDGLGIKNKNLTNEREQLISKNENLTNEREQLRNKLIILAGYTAGLRAGWAYYKSSLYYMSNEKKSWTESRRYCTERGADLIIINNKEEQDFVMNMTGSGSGSANVWIGLTDRDVEGTWKWVDNSTLSDDNSTLTSGFSFWTPTEPNSFNGVDEDCAVTRSPGWGDYPCNYENRWSCEKTIF